MRQTAVQLMVDVLTAQLEDASHHKEDVNSSFSALRGDFIRVAQAPYIGGMGLGFRGAFFVLMGEGRPQRAGVLEEGAVW